MKTQATSSSLPSLSGGAVLVELTTPSDWHEAFPAIADFKPTVSLSSFLSLAHDWHQSGGALFAVRAHEKVVAICAVVVTPHLLRGREVWVNLLTCLPEHRSHGFGTALIARAREYGMQHGCNRIILHSGINRDRAHAFYTHTCSMSLYGNVFTDSLAASR